LDGIASDGHLGQGQGQGQVEFLNTIPYFLLHILIVFVETFSEHYNKVSFN